ncbi:MAG: hypothetical protein K6G80_04230 [Treponema sp.]|nr:hypothetical protein [Treponema sp.]
MKKIICLFGLCALLTSQLFATVGEEFGIGSGYVHYGDSAVRARNKQLTDSNQVLLHVTAGTLFKLAPQIYFCLGFDTMTDFRWKGSDHINMVDYAGLMGFHLYPGLAGLMFSTEYALGRRTDFVSLDNADDESIHSTQWGNGFKFALAYDFSWDAEGFAPVIGASWRHMPRGGSSDDIIAVFIRIVNN